MRAACPLLALLLAGLASAAATARAEVRRVALVDCPYELREAVSTALAPWSVEVVPARTRPGQTLPEGRDEARALGRANRASAVLWITTEGGTATLWLYDDDSHQLWARDLPTPPPYDPPTAAGVALSVKTLLRHSAVAPAGERAPESEPRLSVESVASVRTRPAWRGATDPRLGAGVAWSPRYLGPHIAMTALLRGGPGIRIEDQNFAGKLRDVSLTAALRLSTDPGRRVRVAGWAGPTFSRLRVSGVAQGQDRPVTHARIMASGDAGGIVELRVGAVRLQARVEGSFFPLRPRFHLRGAPNLTVPRTSLEGGVGLAIPLF